MLKLAFSAINSSGSPRNRYFKILNLTTIQTTIARLFEIGENRMLLCCLAQQKLGRTFRLFRHFVLIPFRIQNIYLLLARSLVLLVFDRRQLLAFFEDQTGRQEVTSSQFAAGDLD